MFCCLSGGFSTGTARVLSCGGGGGGLGAGRQMSEAGFDCVELIWIGLSWVAASKAGVVIGGGRGRKPWRR